MTQATLGETMVSLARASGSEARALLGTQVFHSDAAQTLTLYRGRVERALALYEEALALDRSQRPSDVWWEVEVMFELARFLHDWTEEDVEIEDWLGKIRHRLKRMPYSDRVQHHLFKATSLSVKVAQRCRNGLGQAHTRAREALKEAEQCGPRFLHWQVEFALLAAATTFNHRDAIALMQEARRRTETTAVGLYVGLAMAQRCTHAGPQYTGQAALILREITTASELAQLPLTVQALASIMVVLVALQENRMKDARHALARVHELVELIENADDDQTRSTRIELPFANDNEARICINAPSLDTILATAFLASGLINASNGHERPNKAQAFYEAGLRVCAESLSGEENDDSRTIGGMAAFVNDRADLQLCWLFTLTWMAANLVIAGQVDAARQRIEEAFVMARAAGDDLWTRSKLEICSVWAMVCHAAGCVIEAEETYRLVEKLVDLEEGDETTVEMDRVKNACARMYHFLALAGQASISVTRRDYENFDVLLGRLRVLVETEMGENQEANQLVITVLELTGQMVRGTEGLLSLKRRLREALQVSTALDQSHLKAWIYAALAKVYMGPGDVDGSVSGEKDSAARLLSSPSTLPSTIAPTEDESIALKMSTAALALAVPADQTALCAKGRWPIGYEAASQLAEKYQRLDLAKAGLYAEICSKLRPGLVLSRTNEEEERALRAGLVSS